MENRVAYIRDLLEWCDVAELKQIRAIINGKLSKRQITPEQQAAMQAARKKGKQWTTENNSAPK